jgi:hypothetical protein
MSPPDILSAKLEGKGGTPVNAFSDALPALQENGVAMSVGFMKPWYFSILLASGQRFKFGGNSTDS